MNGCIRSAGPGQANQSAYRSERSDQLQQPRTNAKHSSYRPDAGTTEVFKRNSTWQTESLSWLGLQKTLTGDIQSDQASLQTSLADPVSGLGVSDNMVFDRATGRLTSYTDFSGNLYEVTYANHGRDIEVSHAASGYRETRRYDALGNMISKDLSSGLTSKQALPLQTRVERDVYGRPQTITKGIQTTRFDYQRNGFLSEIDQMGQTIRFPKHEPTGTPTAMVTSDGSKVDIDYWEDGRSVHLIESYPINGLPSFYEYDKFGNLVSMQEEGRPCITFSYNGYSFPTELSTGGNAFSLFDGATPNLLTLPGGVEIEVDGRGQEYRRSFPGLADQIFERDGSGRVRSVQVNGELAVGIDYNGPYPTRRTMMQSEAGPQEVVDLTYQDDRLVASDSSLYGLHEFEYSADFPETLTTYTRADFEYSYDLRSDGLLDSLSFGSSADTQTLYYDYNDAQRISQVDFLNFRANFNDYSDGLPSSIAIRYAGAERQIEISQEGGFLTGYSDTSGAGAVHFGLDSVNIAQDQDSGCSQFEASQRVPTRALKYTDHYLEATVTSVRDDQTLVDAHIVRAAGDLAELGLGENGGSVQASKRASNLESLLSDVQNHDETQPLKLGLDIDLDGSDDTNADLLVRRHAHGRSDLLQTLSQNLAQTPGEDQLMLQLIVERYGSGSNNLVRSKLERHLMILNLELNGAEWQGTLDYYPLDQLIASADSSAYQGRVNQLLWQRSGAVGDSTLSFSYDTFGNIDGVPDIRSGKQPASFDGARRIYQQGSDRANYDSFNRRIDNSDSGLAANLVYAYHDSKPIAIGYREGSSGKIQWAYVIVHGPLGPLFLYDMDDSDQIDRSYLVYTDHLGTPWAYRSMTDGALFHQSTAPWGDLNHNASAGDLMDGLAVPHAIQIAAGEVPEASSKATTGGSYKLFDTPDFGNLHPFLGLSGHIRDRTGLTYMHNRYYSPLLGHFLTPDFRGPDIYDPSTFTEPYAYAAGNPFMYWDADGLANLIWGKYSSSELVIEEGDSLESIWELVLEYGLLMKESEFYEALIDLNPGVNLKSLNPGKTLRIPSITISDVMAKVSFLPEEKHFKALLLYSTFQRRGNKLQHGSLKGLLSGINSDEWFDPETRRELERLGCRQYACVNLASDALAEGFKKIGDTKLHSLFRNRSYGLQMQKDLVNLGWKAYYLTPNSSRGNNLPDIAPQHLKDLAYLNNMLIKSKRKVKHYTATDSENQLVKIPISGAIYDYKMDVDGTPNKALEFLQNTRFAVGTWAGGKHVWLMIDGVHYEVHYDEPHNGELFELRPIEDVTWTQGLIVIPPIK